MLLFKQTVILVMLVPSSSLSAATPPPEYLRLLEQGEMQFNRDEPDEAARSWARARRLSPADPRSYLLTADAFLQQERQHDARLELLDLLNLPVPANLLTDLVDLLRRAGLDSQAVTLLEEYRRGGSEVPAQSLRQLADLYAEGGKTEPALEALDSFILLAGSDRDLRMRRARLLIRAMRLEEALEELEKIVARHPEDAEAFFQLATTLRLGNNLEAAERMIARALDLVPGEAGYLHLAGQIAHQLDKNFEARDRWEQAARSPGVFSRVFFDLGNLYRELGDSVRSREALNHYRTMHEAEEDRKNRAQKILQLTNQGETLLQQGNISEARAAFLRALEEDPGDWNSHLFLAKLSLSFGPYSSALPHLERLRQRDPGSSEVWYLLALHSKETGMTRRALMLALEAYRLRPGYPELRNLLGNIYVELNQLEEARLEYRAAMELAPQSSVFRANYKSMERLLGPDPNQ